MLRINEDKYDDTYTSPIQNKLNHFIWHMTFFWKYLNCINLQVNNETYKTF